MFTFLFSVFLYIQTAKQLTLMQNYEDSISFLRLATPTAAQHDDYCFLMACNHFALNDKENTTKWIKSLRDGFHKLNIRHEIMANAMEDEMEKWKVGDFKDIGRDMRISGDRLESAKADKETQVVQKRIIDKLDKLIDEAEDAKKKQMEQDANAKGNTIPSSQGSQQSNPAMESQIMKDIGKGEIDTRKLRHYEKVWGTLPDKERKRVVNDMCRELPSKYRPMIESYFLQLSRQNGISK